MRRRLLYVVLLLGFTLFAWFAFPPGMGFGLFCGYYLSHLIEGTAYDRGYSKGYLDRAAVTFDDDQ